MPHRSTEGGLLVVLLRVSALPGSLRGRVDMPLVLPSVLSPRALFHAVLHPLTFHLGLLSLWFRSPFYSSSSLSTWTSLLGAQKLICCKSPVPTAQLPTRPGHSLPIDIYFPFWAFTGPMFSFFLYLFFPVCVWHVFLQ